MTAPLSPDVLAGLAEIVDGWHHRRLPLRRDGRAVDDAAGDEIAACRSAVVASDLAAICNALPGLLATVAARDREIAALRDRLALAEARTAVPPPREALPGLRALAASEAAADVLRLAAPKVSP